MSGTVRHVARITVELASPLAVGSGAWDELMDSPFALDASGLPTILGTSLAGALRSRWQRATTEQDTKRLFGFQERVRDGEEDGAASEVCISFAAIHDSLGRPAACRLDPEAIESDPVLRFARLGLVRPHVRIDHRGAADALGRGLFDRSQVAVGHRFSFELSIQGSEVRDTDLLELLATLESASFRLGGRSRSGLGRFEIKEILLRRFDLRDHDDYDDYCRLPVDLNEEVPAGVLRPVPIEEVRAQATAKSMGATCVLQVTPRGFWLIGGGRASDDCGEMHRVDIAPYSEP
ncbi:MAG: hypothetical protein IT190_07890, partial [Microbacteriaceae bacterium]|nr:hypothetical protein [Microbacteriaceae bacterium]